MISLAVRGVSESQCTVIEEDPPDLVVTWENGAQWGVEVTRTYQQVESLGGGKPVSSAQTAATQRNFAEQLGERPKTYVSAATPSTWRGRILRA